jgi:hypothetical protein
MLVGAAGWPFVAFLQFAHVEPADKFVWLLAGYPFSSLVPIAWFVIAAEYADRGHLLTRRRFARLAVEPVVIFLLAATTDVHGLVWTTQGVTDLGPVVVIDRTFGPEMWLHVLYIYALIAAGAALFVRAFRSAEGAYRGQAAALLALVVAPLAGNLPVLDRSPGRLAARLQFRGVHAHRYRARDRYLRLPVPRSRPYRLGTRGVQRPRSRWNRPPGGREAEAVGGFRHAFILLHPRFGCERASVV